MNRNNPTRPRIRHASLLVHVTSPTGPVAAGTSRRSCACPSHLRCAMTRLARSPRRSRDLSIQPFGSSIRPSMPREKNPSGYGTRITSQLPSGCKREQRVGVGTVRERQDRPEAEHVVTVNEVVVLEVDRDRVGRTPLKRGPGTDTASSLPRQCWRIVTSVPAASVALAPVEAGR